MKILMLADTMDIGGAETHIYELSRSLFCMGHEVKIFSGGGKTAELFDAEATLIKTDALVSLPRSIRRAVKELLGVLRDFKPEVIHAHTRRSLFIAELALRIAPFPLVFTAHARFSPSAFKRIFTKPPHHTVAVSRDIKEHFARFFGAKNVTVIENGIDTERFLPLRKAHQGIRILNVSRLDTDCSKAAELLCRLAPDLAKKLPLMEISIIGGGGDLCRIKKLADEANMKIGRNAVICHGTQSDVLPFLRNCDIFVGVSRAALEAMCAGLPAIICGSEGYFGICDKTNFGRCSRENFCARGYPQANANLLFNDILGLSAKLGEKSLYLRDEVTENYSAHKTSAKVAEVYKKAIADFNISKKTDAVICGYYGFGNLGDELVLERILKNLEGKRVAIIGAHGKERISRLNIFSAVWAIRSTKLFILGGGSLLQNSTSRRSLEYYLTLLRIARFFGKKVMIYANGLGPIYGKKAFERCRLALLGVDVASFRDSVSFEASGKLLGEKTKSYLSCDPVLLSRPAYSPKEEKIAVFIRGGDLEKSLEANLKKAFLRFRRELSQDIEIVFASMNQKHDEMTAARLADVMPFPVGLKFFNSGEKLTEFISSCKFVISSRLHATVIAASAGIPFIAICRDPKLFAFSKDCELPKCLALSCEDNSFSHRLLFAMKYAVENENSLSELIKKRADVLRALGEQDQKTLSSLLHDG